MVKGREVGVGVLCCIGCGGREGRWVWEGLVGVECGRKDGCGSVYSCVVNV